MGSKSAHREIIPAQTPVDIRVWHLAESLLEFHEGIAVTHPYPRHWHEEYLICAITGGAGYLQYPGGSLLTPRDTLFIVNPGEVHGNEACEGGCSFQSVYVPVDMMRNAAQQAGAKGSGPPVFSAAPITDSATISSFLRLHSSMDNIEESSSARLQRETLLVCFLIDLMHRHLLQPDAAHAMGRECVAVRRAREFLDEHYDGSVSLDSLGRLTGLSGYHLHRTFCKQTGIPPHAYQLQVRIARAKNLLRRNEPLSNVALATGFADQSHFTRHFKRLVGVTPSRYHDRKNVQDLPASTR